jgi:hypothetical protein
VRVLLSLIRRAQRVAGYKHMIRPHAEEMLRLIPGASKSKGHVWFWGSETMQQASVLVETMFLGTKVRHFCYCFRR